MDEQAAKNTDREIWRKGGGDGNVMSYYENNELIGVAVDGIIFVKSVEEWHALAKKDIEPNLGCATTFELINELHARADIAKTIGEEWPNYKTVNSN